MLVLVVEALARVAIASHDLEIQMQVLDATTSRTLLRWELALPVLANAGLLILCRLRRGVVAA